MFAKLWRWLTRKRVQRTNVQVVLFSRSSCPLCDDAHALLVRTQALYGFAMEVRNVDASVDWQCDFGDSVPVVTIDGTVRFRGHVNEVLLRRILEAPA